jgi:hypothetical protein
MHELTQANWTMNVRMVVLWETRTKTREDIMHLHQERRLLQHVLQRTANYLQIVARIYPICDSWRLTLPLNKNGGRPCGVSVASPTRRGCLAWGTATRQKTARRVRPIHLQFAAYGLALRSSFILINSNRKYVEDACVKTERSRLNCLPHDELYFPGHNAA